MEKLTQKNIKKLKEEDRRLFISDSSSRINHDDQMLMNNQTRLFAICVMIIAILALIVSAILSSNSINLSKIITLSGITNIFLLIAIISYWKWGYPRINMLRLEFENDRKRETLFKKQLYNYHFNYLKG